MRTLIVSDLHLGNRHGRDVLRHDEPRDRLLEALSSVDRLVLLGDTVELMTRSPRHSMTVAEPVLRDIGRRLGRDREVVVVAGNHDAPLVRQWTLTRGRALGLDESVAPTVTRALQTIVAWLSPAQVSVRYPGVRLQDGVWATHGHYLDRHLVPESAFGLPRGRLRHDLDNRLATPFDYERARHGHRGARSPQRLASRIAARPVATTLECGAELLRRVTLPRLPLMLKRVRMASLSAAVVDAQMRHAALAAMDRVAHRLRVDAEWVVFGHVHRLGPRLAEPWPDAGSRLLNCGSWIYEPLLVDRATPPHPYWPGGAVLLESGRPPRAVGLLDELGAEQLTAGGARQLPALARARH